MNSRDYKVILRTISFNALKKRFPGLDKKLMQEVASTIALNIHARMYGANVDGVDSPIWHSANGTDRNNDPRIKPNVDATELLKEILT